MTPLQPEPVQRDKYGSWTHSQLPDFGECCSYQQIDSWAEDKGIHVAIRHMENEIDEEHPAWKPFFEDGDASFAKWEPMPPTPKSFLISLHDTEDGPVAWWAMPGRK
ncbi:hypothetical protein [Vibrio parahaemolyticus]|uniref:hypothetical protein n=1 Tax=Vibrio parahaemolyticus TaxID=670 RepID=UPI0003F71B4C|nr:hypothetical protein [Vibrio parahaemolyticus]